MELKKASLTQLRELLDTKQISAPELFSEYMKSTKEKNLNLQAYITLTAEVGQNQAQKAQEVINAGESKPLTGIPLALKDNICTEGIPTTCASKMLENFIPPYSATVIERLEQQNYTLVGKASLDEFAMGGSTQTSAFAKTKNPHDLSRVPGGSSGGSAAAVSAGLCAAALGTDTGGSIRQPSAFCGVTGLKPTYGRVSRYGAVAFGSSFDQIGPIAKSAKDCGILLNAIAGHDPMDATSSKIPVPDFNAKIGQDMKGLRIALPKEFFESAVEEEVKKHVMNAAYEYEKMGAVLVDCSMKTLKYAVSAYYLISSAEAASNLSRFDGVKYGLKGEGNTYEEQILDSRNKGFGDEVKRRILLGNYALSSGYYDDYYIKALALKQEVIKEFNEIFTKTDVILTPTTPTPACKIGVWESDPVKMYQADICTVIVNIASLPAITTPCGYTENGLPVGMSLIGNRFEEDTLIWVSDAFERTFDYKAPEI